MKSELLSNLFEFDKKSTIKAGDGYKLGEGKFPFYTSSNILTKSINKYLFSEESLIFGTGGQASIHYCNEKFAVSTDCFVTRAKLKDNIFVKFVYYYLSGNIHILENGFKGAGLKHISKDYISNIQIPLPPLEEQKKIASILDTADELRQKDKALVEKYNELTQALFLDMFGDPVSNPKGWEKKKLGLVTQMRAGKFVPASEIYSGHEKGLFPCYGGNGLRGFVKTNTHEGDFVLIGRQGALCGNVKIATGKFHATEHAIVCSPKLDFKTLWLYYLLEMINLNKYATGAAQPGLNVGTLEELEVIFAPIKLQNQFAERVNAIEEQKSIAQAGAQKSEELFNSLLQKAFSGGLV